MPDLNFKRIMGGGQRTRLRQSAMRATGGRQDAERASCQRGAGQARGRGAHKNNMATASVRAPVGTALRDASPATRRRAWTQRHACARARTGARQCGAPNTNIVAHDWAQAAPRMAPRRREGSGSRAARQGLRARAALKVTRHARSRLSSSPWGLRVGGQTCCGHKLTKRGRSLAKPNQQRRTPTKETCPQHFSATLLRGNGHFFTNCGHKLLQRYRTFLPVLP